MDEELVVKVKVFQNMMSQSILQVTQQPAIKEAWEAMAQQGGSGAVVAVAVDVNRVMARARVPKKN
jgi:hypothetical protein